VKSPPKDSRGFRGSQQFVAKRGLPTGNRRKREQSATKQSLIERFQKPERLFHNLGMKRLPGMKGTNDPVGVSLIYSVTAL